jgi:hypothetical protein
MKRIAAFTLATWSAAAILYFGQHSVALIALSGVVVLAASICCALNLSGKEVVPTQPGTPRISSGVLARFWREKTSQMRIDSP